MSRAMAVCVGDLHSEDLGRIVQVVDGEDDRRQITGKLVGVHHVLIGADFHTTIAVEFTSSYAAVELMMPSSGQVLAGPPVTSRAELIR